MWIVQHDESPDTTVLGVFATLDEADVFMDEVRGAFENGVICGSFPVGYRYTDEVDRYRTPGPGAGDERDG